MYEPRPAMISARPADSRSIVANCSHTRTGSSEDKTVTELVSRICRVTAAAAASRIAGADPTKSLRWCSPTPNTSRPAWSAARACSMISRTRCRGDGTSPVTGSLVTSPNVMIPISNAISDSVPGRYCAMFLTVTVRCTG